MQKLVIEGGIPLEGEIFLHGAKNSALPILAGTLLCDGETTLENCPRLTDVFAACRILTHLGCRCMIQEHTVTVQVRDLRSDTIPEALMQEMRSSIIFLGAVLGRSGSCHLSYPGGCELGPRPIDMHLDALAADGRTFFCTWGTAGLHRTGGTARRSHTPAVPFGGSDRKRDAGGGAGRGQNGAAQCGERAGDLRPGRHSCALAAQTSPETGKALWSSVAWNG